MFLFIGGSPLFEEQAALRMLGSLPVSRRIRCGPAFFELKTENFFRR